LRSRWGERESQRSTMRGKRTIRRALVAAACGCLLIACKARENGPKGPPPRTSGSELGPRSVALARPEPSGLPAAVAETLSSVHERKLVIAPPRTPAQRLEFGRGRLVQAAGSLVVFRETTHGDALAEVNLGAVRAVAHGADGSLFALGASGGTRFDARASSARPFPNATFLPDSTLFPDLEEPSHFLIFYRGTEQLYQYSFETEAGAFLAIDERFTLEGCEGALGLLDDGAFVCRTSGGLARKTPRGRRTLFNWPVDVGEATWLLPARRLDEVFSVSAAGEVCHLRLEPEMRVLGRFRLPAQPYAAASNAEALAFVTVSSGSAQARRWTLLVTDPEGLPRFQTELPAQPAPPGDNWLETVTADKSLAISRYAPLVAVGGPQQVTVWDYEKAIPLFSR